MVEFLKIIIQGFKSVKNKLVLDLTNYNNGVIFITGNHESNSRLGSNGIGKSTILPDALSWVIYGKTTRNKIKAGNIVNWSKSRPCFVKVHLNKNGKHHIIKRTQSPNSLKLDDKIVTDSFLEKFIGIPYDSFLYKIIIGQFSVKFFDLKPAEKLKVFSNLLELDIWNTYSDRAKTKADTINVKLTEFNNKLLSLNGTISQLENTSYKQKMYGFEEEIEKKLKIANSNLRSALDIKTKKEDALKILEEQLNLIKEKCEINKPDTKKLNILFDEIEEKDRKLRSEKISCQTRLYNANLEISKLSSLQGTCSRCNQHITGEHINKEIQKFKSIEHDMVDRTNNLSKQLEIISADKLKLREQEKILVKDFNKLKDEKNELQYKLNTQFNNLAMTNNNIKMIGKIIDDIKKSVNPFTAMEKERVSSLKKYKQEKHELESKIIELKTKYDIAFFWIKGFKDIKLSLVKDALEELTLYIQNNLIRIGLEDWKVTIDIDRELTTGDIKSEFTVYIQSPTSPELVPFECWSGGEGQRLKIAGTMGLQDLITSRFGFDSNIEIWDEATAWMSNEGINDLMDILKERADELDKKLFTIDNRDLYTYGRFSDTIKLSYDYDNGTSIVGE
jgi:DNA repair exonuclease SbcCD ATPase subunit